MTMDSTGEDRLAILDDYDFDLPEASIAQTALAERDAARLLLLDRTTGRRVAADQDVRIRDLLDWLRPGDLLDPPHERTIEGAWIASRRRSFGLGLRLR